MTVRVIEFGSADYRAECALRHAVLRAPLGLDLYSEDLDAERAQIHFGLFAEDGSLLACAVAVPSPPRAVKLRQMAVLPANHGRGCGRGLVRGIEDRLAALGLVEVHLHARVSAAGFYERLGYSRAGGEFLEVGIPHVAMMKVLPTG